MKNYNVRLYETQDFDVWNTFISTAKNATFLFHRNFMEYHSNRFQDYSLLVFDEKKLVAVLPANRVENTVYSHQGLTYGGLVYGEKLKLPTILLLFRSVLLFLFNNKIDSLQLKIIPSIYNDVPSEEVNYALFLTEAKLFRRDTMSVLNLQKEYKFSKERKQCIRRGINNGLVIKEETNLKPFWEEILIPNLERKHQVRPVHSLPEIEKLQKLFPNNIRHFNVYFRDKLVAGTTIFVSKNVSHPQYISGQMEKNELGSLDFLYHYLITTVFKDKKYFDFGISNENNGRNLNEGLFFWKETFGTNVLLQNFYEVETENYYLLDNILI